jgi:acetyl-CoA carboxylase carboxyl transferase alpha subunit
MKRKDKEEAPPKPIETRTAFERVQLARHADRPYTLDLIERLFEDFVELHGDKRFAEDPAMVCGLARFHGLPVVVVGHQKGRDTKQRSYRNFGMPKPEGYRKALRVMKLGEKFGRPVFTFIDTPGAYPGIDAEERGQAEAIAYNLREMARIKVPIIVTVIGEGGSGGALAIGVGDQVLMLENSIYSVISPEGCAAILWKDKTKADQAAEGLRLSAQHLYEEGNHRQDHPRTRRRRPQRLRSNRPLPRFSLERTISGSRQLLTRGQAESSLPETPRLRPLGHSRREDDELAKRELLWVSRASVRGGSTCLCNRWVSS